MLLLEILTTYLQSGVCGRREQLSASVSKLDKDSLNVCVPSDRFSGVGLPALWPPEVGGVTDHRVPPAGPTAAAQGVGGGASQLPPRVSLPVCKEQQLVFVH